MPRELLFSFTKKDFRIDFYRGSGPGGQHRNKKDTACRITHIETGLSSCAEDSKSQHTNKKNAFRKLCNKLVEHYTKKDEEARKGIDPERATRTYNENKDLVVDHLTGDKFSFKHTVGRGDLSEVIEARAKKLLTEI